ncbi:MAG: type II toxin-antitoxin system RelE/ParE family toxin [Cyclobacteriaceae bacterium]
MSDVFLTDRALDNVEEIYQYSVAEWGERVADKYLIDFDTAINSLKLNPGLLKLKTPISNRFKAFRVNNHFLICETTDNKIFVLTVLHTSMDALRRLSDLQPYLEAECEVLYQRIRKK